MTYCRTFARAHQRCCLPCVCVLVKERERESFKVPGASGAMLACYRICVLVKGLLSWCMPLKQGQAPGGLGSVIAKEAPTLHDLLPHLCTGTPAVLPAVCLCAGKGLAHVVHASETGPGTWWSRISDCQKRHLLCMTFCHTAARAHQRCCLPCVCVLVKEREREREL